MYLIDSQHFFSGISPIILVCYEAVLSAILATAWLFDRIITR